MTESPQPAASPTPPGDDRTVPDEPTAANPDIPATDELAADDVVLPDEEAAEQARKRLARLAVPGPGLGALADVVSWTAAVTGRSAPAPFRTVRAVVIDDVAADGVAELPSGTPLAILADRTGVSVRVARVAPHGTPAAIDERDALTGEEARIAFDQGRDLADRAADEGTELIVLAVLDHDAEVAAAAVVAAIMGAEFPTLLGRVESPDGHVDDVAWMRRCGLVRDALRRTRQRRREARELLAALGGPTLAAATGLLVRAAARRTPVLLDGPVGVTAALLARDIAPQVPRWCRLADLGNHPTVRHVADILDLAPLVDLRLGLDEGCSALAALPVIQAGLALAADLPIRPAPPPAAEPDLPEAAPPAAEPEAAPPAEQDQTTEPDLPAATPPPTQPDLPEAAAPSAEPDLPELTPPAEQDQTTEAELPKAAPPAEKDGTAGP